MSTVPYSALFHYRYDQKKACPFLNRPSILKLPPQQPLFPAFPGQVALCHTVSRILLFETAATKKTTASAAPLSGLTGQVALCHAVSCTLPFWGGRSLFPMSYFNEYHTIQGLSTPLWDDGRYYFWSIDNRLFCHEKKLLLHAPMPPVIMVSEKSSFAGNVNM